MRHDCGSVMVEVVAAMVLLAVLVVPLATGMQASVGRAETVRRQAGHLADVSLDSRSAEAWKWSSTVATVWWRPGPVLHVQVGDHGLPGQVVGIWADGWFLGEESPDASGCVSVEAGTWSGLAGAELVVRVRKPGDVWGVPWRCAVPAADAAPPAIVAPAVGAEAAEEVVAHVPSLANPPLRDSLTGAELQAESPGLAFILRPGTRGWCGIDLQDRTQSWRMEVGRALDLYF